MVSIPMKRMMVNTKSKSESMVAAMLDQAEPRAVFVFVCVMEDQKLGLT